MTSLFSFGLGTAYQNSKGDYLDSYFPAPLKDVELGDALQSIGYTNGNQTILLDTEKLTALAAALQQAGFVEQAELATKLQASSQAVIAVALASDEKPNTTPEAYLKLHLLSHRLVKPHGTVLDGIFPLLPNVAWTNLGPIDLEELPAKQLAARLNGETLEVASVDKFPKMTNYVVPQGVRIAHTARVRLGAYIGEGSTIMHEGFVNFNAGTEGTAMIEGRISAGVFVNKGSDLGGGCSTMGTLSGGNNIVISIGSECLIGANAGVGLPLGDRCTVEAGLYITAGSKVEVKDSEGQVVEKVAARELAGKSDLLFRRNSLTGAIEVLTNKSAIQLNEELHANN
ncbi:MAG: 2,3,4,5-tetrahydropyridine-2,6-dicarboxylate N-succinyltransferase [Pseudomonadales bacterium]|nr:2,3,4,5-tetrahydropyridine-2,6-dicarboxylate N-succinyltransferase [Pseudomonadales bacterium]